MIAELLLNLEERRVTANICVLHRENGGMKKEAFFDRVSGEECAFVRAPVAHIV
jgi:hypothetical protein